MELGWRVILDDDVCVVFIPFSQLFWFDSSFNTFGNSSRADFLKCTTIYQD